MPSKMRKKLVMAEVSVIHMPCQEYLTFEVGHRLKKNSAVPFANSAKYIDVWTRVPHKVPVEFDSNFMIDENAISKVGRRVNVDKPHPPWCFAIQLYIVACSVLITHVAQPFVCGHQTIAHCIHLEPFTCTIYGPSRENNTAMSNESARRASILFQPTLPVWERPEQTGWIVTDEDGFNPRSPCGSDVPSWGVHARDTRFNPRSPCGERRPCACPSVFDPCFNPRSPCGKRLLHLVDARCEHTIYGLDGSLLSS